MMLFTKTVEVSVARSDLHPSLEFENPKQRDVLLLTWADAHPNAWRIVLGKTRSHTYAPGSSAYFGRDRNSDSPYAILGRLGTLYGDWEKGDENIFGWRARFTVNHCRDKGFTGGSFRQHDGTYARGCIDLDYTPKTLTFAVNRFREWCGKDFPTACITVKKGAKVQLVWTDPEFAKEQGSITIGPGYKVRPGPPEHWEENLERASDEDESRSSPLIPREKLSKP